LQRTKMLRGVVALLARAHHVGSSVEHSARSAHQQAGRRGVVQRWLWGMRYAVVVAVQGASGCQVQAGV
jgi:hypothetical protein